MISKTLEYNAGEQRFAGYLVFDETRSGKRPGVLVCHEGTGLSAHTRDRANMLAACGYVAFAPDIFGGSFQSREQGIAIINGLVKDPTELRRRLGAALDALKAQLMVDLVRTAAIGFCFGGLAALDLARGGAEIACVVSFHGGLQAALPARPGDIRCKILVCTGAADPFITRDKRAAFEQEMTDANADWQLILYAHAQHGFTNPGIEPTKSPGAAYHEPTDKRSWLAMRQLFDEAMGPIALE